MYELKINNTFELYTTWCNISQDPQTKMVCFEILKHLFDISFHDSFTAFHFDNNSSFDQEI